MNKDVEMICEAYLGMKKVFKVDGKPVRFVRYGGLSPVRQRGFKSWKNEGKPYPKEDPEDYKPKTFDEKDVKNLPPTFHTPPAKKGIFAFIWPYVDLFLLGGTDKWTNEKDINGNVINDEGGSPKKKLPKRKVFDYYGNIWHHLKFHVKQDGILAERGSWVKTSFETFIEALKKEVHAGYSADVFKGFYGTENDPHNPNWKRTGKPFSNLTKDHLEVFIEDIR